MYMPSIEAVLGEDSYFLARGKRRETLQNETFILNGEPRRFAVRGPEELDSPADLILLAVKNHHLDGTAPLLQAAAGPNTVIVSVLNGIESEAFLKEICPESTVLYCAVLGMDAVKEGNTLAYTVTGRFLVGSGDNDRDNGALLCFTAFLDRTGLAYTVPEDIHRELWYKWMINMGINQVSAVTGATYGTFQTDPSARSLMADAMGETIRVARAEGINLTEEDLDRWEKVLSTLGAEGKTSMLQDREAGRKTEVDCFSGRLIQLADRHGLEVPVNRTLYRIVKTAEGLLGRF